MTTTPSNIGPLRNATRCRVALGSLPVRLRSLEREVRAYRRDLEAACIARHGGIDVPQAHAITAAAEAFQHACIARWLMRTREDMPPDDLLKCSEAIMKAGQARNAAVARIKLDPPTAQELQEEYMRQLYTPLPPAAPTSPVEENANTNIRMEDRQHDLPR